MPVRFFALLFLIALSLGEATKADAQIFGSGPADRTQPICFQLRQLAAEGQKTALRDLGSLLSDPVHGSCAREEMNDLLLIFENKKAVLSSKNAFLTFFYEKKNGIWFDPLLAAWRSEPLDRLVFESKIEALAPPPTIDVQLKKAKKALADALLFQKEKADPPADSTLAAAVHDLAQLRTAASDQAIWAFSKTVSAATPRRTTEAAASALRMQPSAEAIELVLAWAKKGWLDGDEAEYSISCQLNHFLGTNVASVLADRWKMWRDSLGSIDAIRQAGFEGPFATRPSFFQDETDYWGHILSLAGDFPWVRYNAIERLARSENPRALLFLAAIPFQNREPMRFRAWPAIREEAVRLIEKRTAILLAVPDSTGKSAFFKPHDPVWALRFAAFWAKNWQEMERDPRTGAFVDRRKTASATDEADRLFRRLSSSNDSVALAAYGLLIETDPSLVLPLAEQFRSFSRGFNPLLPSFKYRFLESLVQLTAFCRTNGNDWRPSARAQFFFDRLDESPPPPERYRLENEAIRDLVLADATALEIEACRRQSDLQFSYSISRVLNFLYARSWPEVVENESELRLFAKKTALFAQIGAVGSCNDYEKSAFEKLLAMPQRAAFAARAAAFSEAEDDPDVRLFYEKAVAALAGEKASTASETAFENLDWTHFFERPDLISDAEMARLPALGEAGEAHFFKKFKREKSPARQSRYLDWLAKNADPSLAVELAAMLEGFEKADSSLRFADRAVDVLDRAFDAKTVGKPAVRLAFWQKNAKIWGKSTPNWYSGLLQNQLSTIAASDTLRIDALNRAARSPFFVPATRAAILAAIPKVRPATDLRRLALPEHLRTADLAFFQSVALGFRDLDDLGRLFEADRPEVLLQFFIEKSAGFGEANRAQFFNDLMRQDWLRAWLSQLEKPTVATDLVQKALENRIENEELTEPEENATQANLVFLRGIGLAFAKKLAALDQIGLDERARAKLQREILATASWADLPELAPLFAQLAPTETGEPGYFFLTTDFGLPPLDWAEPTLNQDFVKIVSAQPPGAAHAFFLKKFGANIFRSPTSMELDLEKVRPILTFGGTVAFTGGSGARRDWTVYGIIKILENEFGTSLAFHEKLNENQTFYTFNSAKRAAAWLRFLEEN